MSNIHAMEKVEDGLVYEFTTDREYLDGYNKLVIAYYKKELELDLSGEAMWQSLSQVECHEKVFVVRCGERVVAGARLTFSSPGDSRRLPMEIEDFRVRSILPDNYGDGRYAEIGRLVVDPEYRGKEVLAQIISALADMTRRQGGGYLFVQAPPLNAVLYRRVCRALMMRVEIHKGLNMACKSIYSHLQLQLLSCDIRSGLPEMAAAVG